MKKVLVDTECWLWWHLHPERLNAHAAGVFEERRQPLLLSAVSSWEMAIKVGLRKLKLPAEPDRFVPERLAEDGIDPLAIEHSHALAVARLPHHHADPFDRLLIAQAQLERCVLMTADPQLYDYEVELLWAGQGAPPEPSPRRRRLNR